MTKLTIPALMLLCMVLCTNAQEPIKRDSASLTPKTWVAPVLTIRTIVVAPAPQKTAGPGSVAKTGQTIPVLRVLHHSFNSLSNIALEWQLLVNGSPGSKGVLTGLPVAAGQLKEFRLPVKVPGDASDEVFLNILYRQKKQDSLHPAGTVIAHEQLLVKKARPEELSVLPKGELAFKDEDGLFTISCPATAVNFQFNKQTGWLQQYTVNGVALLNDSLPLRTHVDAGDHEMDPTPRLQLFSTSTASDLVIVRADYTLPATSCKLTIRYTINALGEMLAEQVMELDTTGNDPTGMGGSGAGAAGTTGVSGVGSDSGSAGAGKTTGLLLARFGMRWMVPAGFDSVAYYGPAVSGMGAGRNDREGDKGDTGEVGIYGQSVRADVGETIAQPSVRWWKIMDRQGKGLLIAAAPPLLSMSAGHAGDRPATRLDIDYWQKNLPYGNYRLSYKVSPIP